MCIFFLRERAKHQFNEIHRSTIRSWEELRKVFLNTYLPPCLAQKVMDEISHFVQMDDESIYEAWEYSNDLLRRCPRYGFSEVKQITTFFSGLTEETYEKMNYTSRVHSCIH